MYRIVGKDSIQISRGDYALIPLKFTGLEDGEEIIFSVSREMDPETPILEKSATVMEGKAYIALSSSETREMESGKYLWDVNIPDFWGEGEKHTPQTTRNLTILGVSHRV